MLVLNFNVIAFQVCVILMCNAIWQGNWAPVTRRDGVTHGNDEHQIHVFLPVFLL